MFYFRDDGKTPSSSLRTLKPDTNDSSSSTPICQRDSLSLTSTTQENMLDKNNTTSSLTEPNRETYSCSSSENGKNTCSIENGNVKESILRFLHRRRQSLSTSSIRSESTLTNVSQPVRPQDRVLTNPTAIYNNIFPRFRNIPHRHLAQRVRDPEIPKQRKRRKIWKNYWPDQSSACRLTATWNLTITTTMFRMLQLFLNLI